MVAPKRYIYILTPGTCDYYLTGEKLWLRIPRGVYLELFRWSLKIITRILVRERQREFGTDTQNGRHTKEEEAM